MAYIISHHDPLHIHKCLGMIVLLNFAYQIHCIVRFGTCKLSVWLVSIHALLSFSSFLLPLPSKRNFTKPMIWEEFRMHSLIFSGRHIICTIVCIKDLWPDSIIFNIIVKTGIVLYTSYLAKLVTCKYGSKSIRTTNSMPYPEYVSAQTINRFKMLFARSQFGATAASIIEDPSICFAPLIAIQIAPFLMTLVRKNKISCRMYHRVYAISLWIGYLIISIRLCMRPELFSLFVVFALFPHYRLRSHISSKLIWTTYIFLSTIFSKKLNGTENAWAAYCFAVATLVVKYELFMGF